MNARVETLTQGISSGIRGDTGTAEEISFSGKGELLSAFRVTDFASAVIAFSIRPRQQVTGRSRSGCIRFEHREHSQPETGDRPTGERA